MDVGCVWTTPLLRDHTHLLLEYIWGSLLGKQIIIFRVLLQSWSSIVSHHVAVMTTTTVAADMMHRDDLLLTHHVSNGVL